MNCKACSKSFDGHLRRPRLLECGHAVCLSCVEGASKDGNLTCPLDRQLFAVPGLDGSGDYLDLLSSLVESKDNIKDLRAPNPQNDLSCGICLERFDVTTRRPKQLQCGHVVCLSCLKAGRKDGVVCPIDRQVFAVDDPYALEDAALILAKVECRKDEYSKSTILFWCVECCVEADESCVREHTICSLKTARRREVKERILSLEREAALRGEVLQSMCELGFKLSACVQRLSNHSTNTQRECQETLAAINDSLELAQPEWKVTKKAVNRAAADADFFVPKLVQELQMLRDPCDFRLEVRLKGPHPSSWRATGEFQGLNTDVVVAENELVKSATQLSEQDTVAAPVEGGEENAAADRKEGEVLDEECALRYLLFVMQHKDILCPVVKSHQSDQWLPSENASQEELRFRFTVHHISLLKVGEKRCSPFYFARDLGWRLEVSRSEHESTPYLEVMLHGADLKDYHGKLWFCNASTEFCLFSDEDNETMGDLEQYDTFSIDDNRWGFDFIKWESLFDPERGFVKDDAIMLEVHLKPQDVFQSKVL